MSHLSATGYALLYVDDKGDTRWRMFRYEADALAAAEYLHCVKYCDALVIKAQEVIR